MPAHRPLLERFWERVDKAGPAVQPDLGPCWLWTAGTSEAGYGQIREYDEAFYAHRLSWEIAHGAIPDGQDVLHRCDVRRCVRPDHLFLGSQADNVADATAKGRVPSGEAHHNHKLTEADVAAIRTKLAEGARGREVAKEFGVSAVTICDIRRGRAWKGVV